MKAAAAAGPGPAFGPRPRSTWSRGAAAAIVILALAFGACSAAPAATPTEQVGTTFAPAAASTTPSLPVPSSTPTPTPVPVQTPTPAPTPSPSPDLGTVTVSLPSDELTIETEAYGLVPINQIVVMFAEGRPRADAEALARRLGGRVVGQLELINAYQLEIAAGTEAELETALATAGATPGVLYAASNQIVVSADDGEIWGVRMSPLSDPLYAQDGSDGYGLIGVQKAWDYIKGSGMALSATQVGIVDSGFFLGTGEFDEGGPIGFTEPQGTLVAATSSVYGSHGTAVATMIGADDEDGGPVGIASVLGKLLAISNTNRTAPPYGTEMAQTEPDPSDPSKAGWSDGNTYAFGALGAIMAQVKAGSSVINLSWAVKIAKADPEMRAVFQAFFERIAVERPDVVFVAAAGNDGTAIEGGNFYPAGFNLPNVITVGNVSNDGSVYKSSNRPATGFEVSIWAPGQDSIFGYDRTTGEVATGNGGTSMAAPQVAAAAALLKSLNPALDASQIKKILTTTSHQKDGYPILAIDEAVRMVINLNRELDGLEPLDAEFLRNLGVIDAVGTPVKDRAAEYRIRGIVAALGPQGTDVTINVKGGNVVDGDVPTSLAEAGDVLWTIERDPGADVTTVVVRRLDSDAGSRITIESIDINGHWTGTITVTDLTIVSDEVSDEGEEACGLALLGAMKDKPLPMTMDIDVDEAGDGIATVLIDPSSLDLGEDVTIGEPEPQEIPISYSGNRVTFKLPKQPGTTASMSGTLTKVGAKLQLKGTMTSKGKGYTAKAVWLVTKPVSAD